MGKFVLSKDVADEWRWKLVADNGETIAVSEGYTTRQSAEHGIEAVQRLAPDATIDKGEAMSQGQGKGNLKKRDDLVPPLTPPADENTSDPSAVSLREEGAAVYADATNFPPGENLNCQISSAPAEGNDSTEGISAGLYTTTDANGSASFHVPTTYLIPDTPRVVTARAYDAAGNSATDELDFP